MLPRLAAVAGLALAGLAGVALAPAPRTTSTVVVHVTEWEFFVSPDTVTTGTVVFTIINDGVFPHDFSIAGRTTPAIPGGQSVTLTVVFPQPGSYTYNSTLDDVDREMWGAITVTGPPLATTATTTATRQAPSLPLRHVADVALPDGSSRFDYQSLDARRRRLYIAHLGADAVTVVDVARRRVVGDVHDVAGVHGVLAVPGLGRVFATATDTHELVTIREDRLTVTGRTAAGSFPDGLDYDPVGERIFVSDKTGGAEIVVDRRGRRVKRIALGGEAGNVRYDAGAHKMLVAVAGREQLATIDPRRLRVVTRTRLAGCAGAHGLYVDPARRLAFVACEDNAALIVVDLKRGRSAARFAVGQDPDVLAFDPAMRRLYVASESGVVAVFEERGRSVRKIAQDFLAEHAHSVAVEPATHLVYFPLEDVDGRPVLRIMAPRTAGGSR
jgi:plastocyanin